MGVRQPEQPEPKATAIEILMILTALAPVTGAMFSGPIMGLTLVTLGLTDTVLILTGLQ